MLPPSPPSTLYSPPHPSQTTLPEITRSTCLSYAQTRFPHATIREAPHQGRCSYTLFLLFNNNKNNTILQFRPPRHALDLSITAAAHLIFGETLVPQTHFLGVINPRVTAAANEPSSSPPCDDTAEEVGGTTMIMLIYTHTLVRGVPLSTFLTLRLQEAKGTPPSPPLEGVVRSLAQQYFIPSLRHSLPPSSARLPVLKRAVGWGMRRQAERLLRGLPVRFRGVVGEVVAAMGEIEGWLPWGLTHGDFLGGGNVLVGFDGDEGGGGEGQEGKGEERLTGLVDWAEGEWLPFGVGLYGLEEVLGRTVTDGKGTRFEYYPDAERLRAAFWEEMVAAVPELACGSREREVVEKARLLGLLLWYGIAFDDGALNRVVQPGRDDEELQKLDLFLLGVCHDIKTSPIPSEQSGNLDEWQTVAGPAASHTQAQRWSEQGLSYAEALKRKFVPGSCRPS
ncbi:hypothetical protein C8A01DRAFT_20326 [Parachaetomium inaequale]|uniref:Aminoglycoside phosphotransferase domain-containing protein n=1 Tax=Parachaetomium inaequale TaxID=2588326 RepID=A0AAN6P938_9PEZI|nr:hypothetical protein C8A01DRAFT_20326 [Parachaetomium inaequale]